MTPTRVIDAQARDGRRLLTFDGELLAFISSREDDRDRWTEMSIYRTDGGSYILEKIGRSTRLHILGCNDILKDLPLFEQAHPGDDPEDGYYSWCPICSPELGEEYDMTKLLCEEDRFWATITTDPNVVIDALYRKREGYTRLPRISVQLLTDLCLVDPAFAGWATERVS